MKEKTKPAQQTIQAYQEAYQNSNLI